MRKQKKNRHFNQYLCHFERSGMVMVLECEVSYVFPPYDSGFSNKFQFLKLDLFIVSFTYELLNFNQPSLVSTTVWGKSKIILRQKRRNETWCGNKGKQFSKTIEFIIRWKNRVLISQWAKMVSLHYCRKNDTQYQPISKYSFPFRNQFVCRKEIILPNLFCFTLLNDTIRCVCARALLFYLKVRIFNGIFPESNP